jgi:hypothetical protein
VAGRETAAENGHIADDRELSQAKNPTRHPRNSNHFACKKPHYLLKLKRLQHNQQQSAGGNF